MELQLSRLRKEAGFKSRKDFADETGFTERQIKAWEAGERRLRLFEACELADALKCTLDELAGRSFHSEKIVIADNDPDRNLMEGAWEGLNATGRAEAAKRVCELAALPVYTDSTGKGDRAQTA